VDHFNAEHAAISALVSQQQVIAAELEGSAKPRTLESVSARVERNQAALVGVQNVLIAIRKKGEYSGAENRFKRPAS
jgi:hypothetical protein